VLRTAQPEDVPNIPYILPGGESRHANMRLSPLKDGDGEVIGVLGTRRSALDVAARGGIVRSGDAEPIIRQLERPGLRRDQVLGKLRDA
jgi:hypothetical protein